MLQMLISTLREGIEAFLIVAIAAAYLRKTGRTALLPAVWWGTATALMLSFVLGAFLAETVVTPFWEGVLATIAAVLVTSMALFMSRAAKNMRADIGARLETAAARTGPAALVGVFLFTVLMITREGMEMAFITVALSRNEDSASLVAGAIMGTVLAAALALAWVRYGRRVNLGLFFQITAIFLVIFALQLMLYSFHEFTEANAIPGIDNAYWHIATEEWAEGTYGKIITSLMVLLPLAWMGRALLHKSQAPRHA
jgi:high-affinity iron transporter